MPNGNDVLPLPPQTLDGTYQNIPYTHLQPYFRPLPPPSTSTPNQQKADVIDPADVQARGEEREVTEREEELKGALKRQRQDGGSDGDGKDQVHLNGTRPEPSLTSSSIPRPTIFWAFSPPLQSSKDRDGSDGQSLKIRAHSSALQRAVLHQQGRRSVLTREMQDVLLGRRPRARSRRNVRGHVGRCILRSPCRQRQKEEGKGTGEEGCQGSKEGGS